MKKDLIIKLAVTASVVAMFVVNSLANILPINGITTGALSDAIPIYFVPAGYVFSIWGLIYAGLVVYMISMFTNFTKEDRAIYPWVIASSLANAAWIFLWHYRLVYVSVIAMVIILASLIAIYTILHKAKKVSVLKTLPFNIYLGWISVASIANVSAALYVANWNGFGISPEIWSAIMIIVATGLAVYSMYKKTYSYSLVILWAIIGILVKFSGLSNPVEIATTVGILAIISVFGVKLYFNKSLK